MIATYCRTITTGTLLAVILLAATIQAEMRHLSLPSYRVNTGAVLEVPVVLDNAAGLAAVQVQVNFDSEVLELLSVKSGPLGDAFEMTQGDGEGFTQLTFFRAAALAGGSGRLASLKFRANPGAVVDLVSELAIADLSLSDVTGVIDLRQKDTLTLTNGEVAVSALQNIDNAGSGLPDWWEELHELDPFTDNQPLDSDNDGLINLLEYAFGGNPKIADAHERGIQAGRIELNGKTFLSVGFYRRLNDPGLLFHVQESADLGFWNELPMPQQILGTPQNMGDGTEHVNVLGTLPITGPGAEPKGFLRVKVEKP